MGKIRRVVVPGFPHHVVVHGARSADIFESDTDRRRYIGILSECALKYGLSTWAWCLMTNHIHLVVVPKDEAALGTGIGETHRRYSRYFNRTQGSLGHLFRERFFSYPVQLDSNLLCVARYVELNPVMAGLAASPEAYPWSSARHHITGRPDPLLSESPLLSMVPHWKEFVDDGAAFHKEKRTIERCLSTGRPLGSRDWVATLESKTGRPLALRKVGRKLRTLRPPK